MTDMVEKVARALEALPVRDRQELGGELDRLRLREAARAAIEAMREPSEEMVQMGCLHEAEGGSQELGIAAVWRAMTDAALGSMQERN